jgi:hypothetical protein
LNDVAFGSNIPPREELFIPNYWIGNPAGIPVLGGVFRDIVEGTDKSDVVGG